MIYSKCVKGLVVGSGVVFVMFLGCAKVNIVSKDPIKVDVTMRLDIYQHVSNDVNSIEDLISGPSSAKEAPVKTSLVFLGVQTAYAENEEDFPADILRAIESRRERRDHLTAMESQGVIGENSSGLVELRGSGGGLASDIVSRENSDRQKINAYVAKKNGASVDETAKISAQRIQNDAPQGTPIETAPGVWTTK